MKLLAVDVGNTNTKRCVITDGDLGEVLTEPTVQIDEVAEAIASTDLPVGLSSVRPRAADKIKAALAKRGSQLALEIDYSVARPVSGFYQGMGADRIADVAAAWSLAEKRQVAVIGLGTGTTITAVSGAGNFLGGFTTLGLGPICKVLTEALPALPPIDPCQTGGFRPAFDAHSALCRGTVLAHLGLIEKWVSILRTELGDFMVIATGGWSSLIAPLSSCIESVHPHLTLCGIWTIFRSSDAE